MRILLKSTLIAFVIFLFALPLLLAGAVFLALDREPSLKREAEIKPENIARAKRVIESHDPRRLRPGALRTLQIGGADLDLALNYLANRYARGSATVRLQEGQARVRASLGLPANPLGAFLNIDAVMVEAALLPEVAQLTVGRLQVPSFVANYLVRWAFARVQNESALSAASDAIRRVQMRGGTLLVEYEWSDRLPDAIRAVLVSGEDQARLQAYQARIRELAATGGPAALPMEELLRALLRLAGERGGDAVAENRAALIALAFFVNGKGLAAVIPAAKDWPRAPPRNVSLGGRHDFAQHYSISAAIAASAGSPLADAIGVYREIDDARGGSGFSFNDIAADRAGVRLGELATANAGGAQKVQRTASVRLAAADILPETKDLPEFLQEAEFKRRYGGIGGPDYKKMMAEIERRVAALAILR